ncbi:hypothetical protein [Agrococcus sp. DT81.2]|uniref:hypothetical protein n=1 Tax=Agrococcus sp. DT81.2 TaxID=3393414 RepID=UPI003CE499A1
MADSDLTKLAHDLSNAPVEAWDGIKKAVGDSALAIKDTWAENLGGKVNEGSAFKWIGGSIDYDLNVTGASLAREALGIGGGGTGYQAEIGPNLARRQGAMAGWWEEGMRNIPALHPGYDAMKKEEPRFEFWVGVAVDEALRKSGL